MRRFVPISIHWLFWALAALIGYAASGTMSGTVLWMGIIFGSVIVHEFGHALTACAFRQKAQIQLLVFGGLTSYEGPRLTSRQQFLIVLNGPLASLLLVLLAAGVLTFVPTETLPWAEPLLRNIQFANLFWSLLNLLPILPLDGGQLLRIVLEAYFGVRGLRASFLIGAICAVLLGGLFFLGQNLLGGALFILFAFQSFEAWRQFRYAVKNDTEEKYKLWMTQAEEALQQGNEAQAKELLTKVREGSEPGVLYVAATEILASFAMKQGDMQQAFDLLLPLKEKLPDATRCWLHQAAAAIEQDVVVAELATVAYQEKEEAEVALQNAKAFARLKQGKLAGGWLQTALQQDAADLPQLLAQEPFFSLRNDPEFLHFFADTL